MSFRDRVIATSQRYCFFGDSLMRGLLPVLAFVALTVVCWGVYGPVLHYGQNQMDHTRIRPFICVGLAYFLVAVLPSVAVLSTRKEQGHWTASGAIWSLGAGAAGAIGALGIILASNAGGSPVYIMPLVFGLAPVINTFATMWMSKTYNEANVVFYAGVAAAAIGASGLLFFKPGPKADSIWTLETWQAAAVLGSILLTAFCWGLYGPVLHKGQMKMAGSRLRPLLCVGLSYFVLAVILASILLATVGENGSWKFSGTVWSLAGGIAGAVGAYGIILAFNFGGKPVYVMPLVFGGAPIVNTFTSIAISGKFNEVPAGFYISLLVAILGAVTVLVFAPKGHGPAKPGKPDPHGNAPGKPVPKPFDEPEGIARGASSVNAPVAGKDITGDPTKPHDAKV